MRNLQICPLFVRQLKLMILINCVQSEDCANFVDCVFVHTSAIWQCIVVIFFIFLGLAPMREKTVAVRVSVRQSPNV